MPPEHEAQRPRVATCAHEELRCLQRDLDFPATVYGIPREQLTMAQVSSQRAQLFGRHTSDRVLP